MRISDWSSDVCSSDLSWSAGVNRFWFEELSPSDWYRGDAKVDAAIGERFGELHASLKARPPAPDALDPEALVAAVIVFDQFSRNLFRGSGTTYATEAPPLKPACPAIHTGIQRQPGPPPR